MAPRLRALVTGLDPNLPVFDVEALPVAMEKATWAFGLFGSLFTIFGLAALFIAAAVRLFLGDDGAVHRLHRRMVARTRDNGALGLLAWALPRLAVSDIWAGRWTAAATGLAEAEELARLVEASKSVFVVSHNYTGYPLVRQAREMILAGELGEIQAIRAEYIQGWLRTSLESEGQKQAAWRTDPTKSGAAGWPC